MSTQFGYDIPGCLSQNIIGGDNKPFSGRCYYAGKPQGQKLFANTPEKLKKILLLKMEKLKENCTTGYPDPLWDLRIYA